jgi:hypothetical protein
MTDTYIIYAVKQKEWKITKFSDYKEPDSSFQVTERGGHYHCNCPGYSRQKNKDEHKHIVAVKHWVNELNSEEGVAVWFENETLKSNKFLHHNTKLKQIFTCS